MGKRGEQVYANGFLSHGLQNEEGGGPQPLNWQSALMLGTKICSLWANHIKTQKICSIFWIGVGYGEELSMIGNYLRNEACGFQCSVVGIDLLENLLIKAAQNIPQPSEAMTCSLKQLDAMKIKHFFLKNIGLILFIPVQKSMKYSAGLIFTLV